MRNCRLDCDLVLVVIGRCLGAAAFHVWKAVFLLPPKTLPLPFLQSRTVYGLQIIFSYFVRQLL